MRTKVWRRTSARNGRVASVVVLIGALVVGVGAAAADPVEDDVITGCYKTANGALRVIELDAGGSCTMSEEQLTWSTGFGVAPPDSVDSAAIQDGVVGEGDLAVSLLDLLASDTEVSTAIGALESKLATSTPGANLVHWTNLAGVRVATSDLAPHAVTSDKLALTTSQVVGGGNVSTGTGFASATSMPPEVTVPAGAHHTIMVAGHAQLACTCPTSGEIATVEWRLYDENDGVTVGETYRGQLSNINQDLAISVSHLDQAAPGRHQYSLQVRLTEAAMPATTVSSAVVSAVDLG